MSGRLTGDPTGPCGLQEDALDEAVIKMEAAVALVQDRAMALMLCQMQQMQPMLSQTKSQKLEDGSDRSLMIRVIAAIAKLLRMK